MPRLAESPSLDSNLANRSFVLVPWDDKTNISLDHRQVCWSARELLACAREQTRDTRDSYQGES